MCDMVPTLSPVGLLDNVSSTTLLNFRSSSIIFPALGLLSGMLSKHCKTRLWRGWSGPISSRSSLRRMYSGTVSPSEIKVMIRNLLNSDRSKKKITRSRSKERTHFNCPTNPSTKEGLMLCSTPHCKCIFLKLN